MNPLDWLKAIYETFGIAYPRASLGAVMVLAALLAGALWVFAAKQVEKDHQNRNAVPAVSGPAVTSGDSSPANTGSGNEFHYGQSPPPEKKKKTKPPK
jgi:hypothetical protein